MSKPTGKVPTKRAVISKGWRHNRAERGHKILNERRVNYTVEFCGQQDSSVTTDLVFKSRQAAADYMNTVKQFHHNRAVTNCTCAVKRGV